MAEREDFVAWLEKLDPPIPTTHDVEVAWRAWQARGDEIERLRAPAVAAQIVKRYIETTRPTGLQSWRSTIFDMDFLAKEPAAQLAQDPLFNPQS